MKKIINIFWLSTLLPIVVLAVDPPVTDNRIPLDNPLSVNSVPLLINKVIQGILGVVGAIALLYLILGGLMWLTSQGNTEKVKKGKETLVWAVAGLAMIFFSYVILSYVFTNFLS
jgi:hypothetical protein